MPKLRVLIVDDAVVVRKILTDSLLRESDFEVFSAPNGKIALSKVPQVNPDLVTLDIEMPELDGLATLRELRKTYPRLPVIMFSTLTERGASATLDALASGANDYVTKPSNVGHVSEAITRIKDELVPKIRALCGRPGPETVPAAESTPRLAIPTRPVTLTGAMPTSIAAQPRAVRTGPIDIVTIGVSTGGPNALSEVLPQLPADLSVPVVIVQHMPPVFTKLLAERLSQMCKVRVREGAKGMIIRAGDVVIAPGGEHMVLRRIGTSLTIDTNTGPHENSCRPAVDVLFRSVVACFGGRTLGVILTGMGSDGLRGCEHISEAGGQVIVQDEATSVVWGMPGFVARAGLAERVLPLSQISGEIVRRVCDGRGVTVRHAKAS